MLSGLSLMGKLTTLGWYRGSVQDAGCFYELYREDGDVGVNLSFSGCYVGDQVRDCHGVATPYFTARARFSAGVIVV
ncbi:MAG: hypothetical protein ACLU9S_21505 [Oscillospiraceae bacterium]